MVLGIIIAVSLGVSAIVIYLTLARHGKRWAQFLVAILVIGAAAAALMPVAARSTASMHDEAPDPALAALRLLGEGLRGKLDPGAPVVIIRDPMDVSEFDPSAERKGPFGLMRPSRVVAWEKALREGAEVEVKVIACLPPSAGYRTGMDRPADAAAFSQVLDEFREARAWISLAGLPVSSYGKGELEDVTAFRRYEPPLAAACVMRRRRPRELKRWLTGGQLQAVVLCDPPDFRNPALAVRGDMKALDEKPPRPEESQPKPEATPAR